MSLLLAAGRFISGFSLKEDRSQHIALTSILS